MPIGIVSTESLLDALLSGAKGSLPDILAYVTEQSPATDAAGATLAVPLLMPAAYYVDVDDNLALMQQYPAMVITTTGARRSEGADQPGHTYRGVWDTDVLLEIWVRESNPEIARRQIQRYGAALLLLVAEIEESLVPWMVDPDSLDLARVVDRTTATHRGASLVFRASLGV